MGEEVPKYSTERLTDEAEQLRQTLLWMVTSWEPEPEVPCATCDHDLVHHADDNGGVCLFPATLGAPFALCRCSTFLAESSTG